MKPAGAGQELVGQGVGFQEVDEALELFRVLGADVGSAALQVLGVSDATHLVVDSLVAEAGVDEDGTADGLAGGLQQLTSRKFREFFTTAGFCYPDVLVK